MKSAPFLYTQRRGSNAVDMGAANPNFSQNPPNALPTLFNHDDKHEGRTGESPPSSNLPQSDGSVQWDSGHDEPVEVDQRALIDKILARYSGEFTGASRVFSVQQVLSTLAYSVS